MRRKLFAVLAIAGFLFLPSALAAAPHVVYVVRHGEKTTSIKDPELTLQGHARARTLAVILGKAGIRAVYSTPTLRTQQTAAPLAQRVGVAVQSYDAAAPALVVEKIKAQPGPTLLVGHSNTIAELVRLLGGAPGAPIGDNEYDRLYQVAIAADGTVTTVMLTSVVAP